MKSQQNITIKIADVPPISMNIDPQQEKIMRNAEYNINKVWNAWRNRPDFNEFSSKQVLAMVTFRFAQLYFQLLDQVERQQSIIDDFEKELDRLLQIESV